MIVGLRQPDEGTLRSAWEGGEWYDFVVERGLEVNDKLIFDLEDPPTKMFVQHVRQH